MHLNCCQPTVTGALVKTAAAKAERRPTVIATIDLRIGKIVRKTNLNCPMKLTCNSIDAFAQRTPLLPMGSPSLNDALQPITLLGDELTEIETSSTPSLSIMDHPSSASPLRVSLKPLKNV
jgi:hypothetical protein